MDELQSSMVISHYIMEYGTAESLDKEALVARRIQFVGESVKRKEHIASVVADHFTRDEILAMTSHGNNVVVILGEINPYADGAYMHKTAHSRNTPVIWISNKADDVAIIHEFVHHSRAVDKKRTGIARSVYPLNRNGRVSLQDQTRSRKNAEECATTAESIVRSSKDTSRPPVYFEDLGKDEFHGLVRPTRSVSYKRDYKVLRRYANGKPVPRSKAMKGDAALKMFERNYPDTWISKKTSGGATALEVSRIESRKNRTKKTVTKPKRNTHKAK